MIKIFEKYKGNEYKVGDYVLLLDDPNNKWKIDLECLIIKITYKNEYKIKSFKDDEIYLIWIDDNEIDRKMTPEEIENYKIKKEAEKYNI